MGTNEKTKVCKEALKKSTVLCVPSALTQPQLIKIEYKTKVVDPCKLLLPPWKTVLLKTPFKSGFW